MSRIGAGCVTAGSDAITGCPEWCGIDNNGGGTDTDKIGYGMSRRLRTPESRTRYHFPGPDAARPGTPTGVNGPISTNGNRVLRAVVER